MSSMADDNLYVDLLVACHDAVLQQDFAAAAASLPLETPVELVTQIQRRIYCLELLEQCRRDGHASSINADEGDAGDFQAGDPPTPAFLSAPDHATLAEPDADELPLERLGRFKIIRELGRGGHGIVFLAIDETLNRRVALKVPRPECLLSKQMRRRFLREAQAAARLAHPNLLAIYESGEDGPLCYLASAYCTGPTLSAWLRSQTAPVPERLAAAIVAAVADGVAYAHERGVLHRDIKPGNVFLDASPDGLVPLADEPAVLCAPKLGDFGLARMTDDAHEATRSGAVLGTPAYMAPEQARGEHEQIGAATDVYGLGTILFELLTGRPPFRGRNDVDILRQVVCDDAPALRGLRREASADLEAICVKCLEKRPAQRYRTSAELAADLRRYLAGEPILARQATPAERLIKWTRRHPTAAALWSVTAIGLVVLMVGTALSNRWLRQERDRTLAALTKSQASERTARRHVYASEIKHAHQAMLNLDIAQCLAALHRYLPTQGAEDLRDFSWNFMWRALHREVRRLPRHPGSVYALAFSADGRLLATACADGKARLWEYATGRLEAEFAAHSGEVNAVAFSSDGARLATGGDDGEAIVWDVAERRALQRFSHAGDNESPVTNVIFSTAGDRLYTAGGHFLFAWNIDTRQQLTRLPIHDRDIRSVSLSADGRFLAATAARLQVFETATWQSTIPAVVGESAFWLGVLFLPDSHRLLVGDNLGGVTQFDVTTSTLLSKLELAHTRRLTDMSYEPESQILAASSNNGVVAARSLDPTRRIEALLLGHTDRVWDVKFSPDGGTLVSAGAEGEVIVWQKPTGLELQRADGLVDLYESPGPEKLRALSYSPDGRYLVFGGQHGNLLLLDCATNRVEVLRGSGMAYALEFMPDGQHIIYGSKGSADGILVYDLSTHTSDNVATLENDLDAVCVSPRGDVVVAASGGRIRRFSLPSWRELAYLPTPVHLPTSIAFSPSGARLAVLSGSELVLYDTATWLPALRIEGFEGQFLDIDFFLDEKRIAVAEGRRSVIIRDALSGRELMQLSGHPGLADSVDLSPDGHTLASVCDHHLLQIWDVRTGQTTMQFENVHSAPRGIQFSPNGGELAVVQDRSTSCLTILDGRPVVVAEPLPAISTGR